MTPVLVAVLVVDGHVVDLKVLGLVEGEDLDGGVLDGLGLLLAENSGGSTACGLNVRCP